MEGYRKKRSRIRVSPRSFSALPSLNDRWTPPDEQGRRFIPALPGQDRVSPRSFSALPSVNDRWTPPDEKGRRFIPSQGDEPLEPMGGQGPAGAALGVEEKAQMRPGVGGGFDTSGRFRTGTPGKSQAAPAASGAAPAASGADPMTGDIPSDFGVSGMTAQASGVGVIAPTAPGILPASVADLAKGLAQSVAGGYGDAAEMSEALAGLSGLVGDSGIEFLDWAGGAV